ncbi:MAG TPA: helix-turn-helix domain-containing protein [Candidatus Nanopelagicaceae bacterium]|nr:helix-turn-helix domain-containing protein [Candidatus Nanopelagicaceae bacterium]
MSANSYELSFEVAEMSEAVEDRACTRFDSVITVHGEVTTITLTAEGRTCLRAAIETISSLRAAGVEPIRLIDDLVSRSEIARRMGVTPQSVGQWIRGERHAESAFPAPYILADGGLWLWGEVVEALDSRGVEIEDIGYPARRDIQEIGGVLAKNSSRAHAVPTRSATDYQQ